MDTYSTPTTTGEVNDMAWSLANGMRTVHDLERRAESVVSSIDRTRDKVQALLTGALSAATEQAERGEIEDATAQAIEDLVGEVNALLDEDSDLGHYQGYLRELVGPDNS